MFKSMFSSGIRSLYAVSDNPTFVCDPWKVYPAKRHKDGKLVSVFIFDKKRFESQVSALASARSSTQNPRTILAECYKLIKFEISQMAKLKHPQVLAVLEPLEETKSKFLFVTEPVINNLQTVQLSKLDPLTIQKGLLQVSKGIQFLHNYCSIIHFNLQPSSIYINDQGDWKLAGFRFIHHLNDIPAQDRDNFYIMNNSSVIPFTNLNLNFTAPELLLDTSQKLGYGNDIFSLGCLVYYLYNNGDYLINCLDSDSISDYKQAFKRFENKFYHLNGGNPKYILKEVPETLYPIFPQILARFQHDRINIDQFIDCEFFNGSIIKAMWFVDEFHTKSAQEKLIYMQGMLEVNEQNEYILNQFPVTFRTQKFLPLIMDLIINELKLLSDTHPITEEVDQIITNALKITLKIGATFSSLTFQDKIYSKLFKTDVSFWKTDKISIPKLLIKSSVNVRLAIMEDIEVFKNKLTEKNLSDLVRNFSEIILAPSNDAQNLNQIKLQELFFTKLPLFIGIFDFPYIKNTLFPSICQVFQSTIVLSTKLETINSFKMFIDEKIIDKLIVIEQLLPILNQLKSRDKVIVKSVLELFGKIIGSEHINLDLETLISQVLPQCWQLSFGCNNCNQKEFESYMASIKSMETTLIEKKLKSLPKNVVSETCEPESKKFDSLVNSQKFNHGNMEEILVAPQSKTVLQPKQKITKPLKNTESTMTPIKNSAGNSRPMTSKQQNKTSKQTTSRIHSSPEKMLPKTPINLSFGASSTESSVNNSALLSALDRAVPNKSVPVDNRNQHNNNDDDDDEFNEFQTTTASGEKTGIDWNVEINKTLPMNHLMSNSVNTPKNSNIQLPQTPPVTSSSNLPPGFSSQVLTPTTGKHKPVTDFNGANKNVLDFL